MPKKKNNGREKEHLLSRRTFLKGISSGAITAAVVPSSFTSAQKITSSKNDGIEKGNVNLIVNDKPYKVEVEAREILADTLRKKLDLTGTKIFCNQGSCGACTVLVDGVPVYSCMILTMDMNNRKITTIEGLSFKGKLHPVQESFYEKDGYQCGFCTSGQIISAVALLGKNANPSLEEVRQGLSGNLCRCGAYPKIFESVLNVATKGRR